MSTSERMLRLLSLLQTHRFWSGTELASRLEVSQRTLRRDVDRLRELGYDVDALRGVAGGYQLRGGKALPPLLLDHDEAVAIAIGLRGSAAAAVDGGGDVTVRALTKVVAMLPPRLRSRLEAVSTVTQPGFRASAPTINAEILTRLAACCRDHEIAAFGYVAKDGAATERRVEPHQLVSFEHRWYLVAFDLRRREWRTFRLDRIADVDVRGDGFKPRQIPGGSALDLVRDGRRSHRGRYSVAVRFACPAEDLQRNTGSWGDVEPDGDGAIWRISTDHVDWPVMLIAQLGVPVNVISPPELVHRVRETGRRMAAAADT